MKKNKWKNIYSFIITFLCFPWHNEEKSEYK